MRVCPCTAFFLMTRIARRKGVARREELPTLCLEGDALSKPSYVRTAESDSKAFTARRDIVLEGCPPTQSTDARCSPARDARS